MSPYNPDKNVRIPTDARLWITVLYGTALGLLVADSLDRNASLLAVWAVFLALAGGTWTCAALHCYSRRVILQVMSWEHQQQGMRADVDWSSLTG